MKIGIGCDHGGFILKEAAIAALKELGAEITDFGTNNDAESVDYPVYAEAVAKSVASGELDLGILLCGTGIGMSIAANKVKGIRAAVLSDEFSARATREHNDSNILCLGGRIISPSIAARLIKAWYTAAFQGGRHQKRVELIEKIERENI